MGDAQIETGRICQGQTEFKGRDHAGHGIHVDTHCRELPLWQDLTVTDTRYAEWAVANDWQVSIQDLAQVKIELLRLCVVSFFETRDYMGRGTMTGETASA